MVRSNSPWTTIAALLTQITTSTGRPEAESTFVTTIRGIPIPVTAAVQSLYIHVPFCFHKCHYCDFYSLVDKRDRQPDFTNRLIDEIAAARHYLTQPLRTIFVGGGTPTLLAAKAWDAILRAMSQAYEYDSAIEFTIEANPETLTLQLAQALRRGGVNRLSIGCQSFNPLHLKTLERWHEPASVVRSVAIAREAGFQSLNLDLIFAIPGQSLDEWRDDLRQAIELEPDHLSGYGLTFEPNTPLTARMRAGQIQPAPQELQAQMYETTVATLADAGFEQYEISNFARPGHECRHNLAYWRNENWWAIGPGAAGHVEGVRWKNVPNLDRYLQQSPWPPITDVEMLDDDGRIGETFMLGLRLCRGLELDRLVTLLSQGRRGKQRAAAIERHVAGGLLQRAGGCLRLTERGRLLADSVLVDLL